MIQAKYPLEKLLPGDLWNKIYSYDKTWKELFSYVLQELSKEYSNQTGYYMIGENHKFLVRISHVQYPGRNVIVISNYQEIKNTTELPPACILHMKHLNSVIRENQQLV